MIICILSVSISPFEVKANTPIRLAVDGLKEYRIVPNSGKVGAYDVLITSKNLASCKDSKEFSNADLVAPRGSLVEATTVAGDDCSLTGIVNVLQDASIGKVTLRIVEKGTGKLLGTAEFNVTDPFPAGQIPPGLNQPEVDIMWSVLPDKIVGQNFGKAVSKNYYAIEIVLGNNSAYTLQIVSVAFKLPEDGVLENIIARNRTNKRGANTPIQGVARVMQSDSKKLSTLGDIGKDPTGRTLTESEKRTILPTSSYRITRGSLEAKEFANVRTIVLGTITALGPLLTGFLPYFHNTNRRANFSEGINILSNPLEKGLELVWRDPKPVQRERFDDQVLRDGLVIRNNTQVRTLAFFPKQLLRLPRSFETDDEYSDWKSNAREIRERLGEIQIIGDMIKYVNRVSLTTNPPGPVTPPPTVTGVDGARVKQGETSSIKIEGTNLQSAMLMPGGETGIAFKNKVVDPNGRYITVDVEVSDTVYPQNYSVLVSTPAAAGRESFTLIVLPEQFVADPTIAITAGEAKVNSDDDPKTIEIEVSGKYLHNAEIESTQLGVKVMKKTVGKDGRKIRADLTIPKGATEIKLQVVDRSNPNATPKSLTIKLDA